MSRDNARKAVVVAAVAVTEHEPAAAYVKTGCVSSANAQPVPPAVVTE